MTTTQLALAIKSPKVPTIRHALVRSPNAQRNKDMLKYLNDCGWEGNDAIETVGMSGGDDYDWGVTVVLRDEQDCYQFERAMAIWGAESRI